MRIMFMTALLVSAGCSRAGMLGDPVTSTLHTVAAGSWTSGSTATVGPGVEFTETFGFPAVLTLDIADSSFTLMFTFAGPGDMFNLGLLGFEFTDLNQTFSGVSLVPGNTFPPGSITGQSVTAHNIHVVMNEPIIPAGTTWTATWNVTSASAAPEPGTLVLSGLGALALAAPRKWRRS